jgi:predicted DNA binding CopG/RHH family protein
MGYLHPPCGVYDVGMRRVNYHLTEQQIAALRKLAGKTGLSVAELVRRAIDAYLAR